MGIPITGYEHLHLHTDYSLLDGFGMVEEYSQRWKKHGKFLCISDHGMMGAVPRQIKACQAVCEELKDKNAFSEIFSCFSGDHRIHTLNGNDKICNIVRGDLVLTHKGRFRPVVNIMSRFYDGDFVNIFLSGSKHFISVTPEHPFLLRNDAGVVSWVKAKDIVGGHRTSEGDRNCYLAIPRLQGNDLESTLYQNYFQAQGRDDFLIRSRIPLFKRQFVFEVDEEFAYFLGLFAAEGSFSICDGNFTGEMTLSLHSDQINLVERAIIAIERYAHKPLVRFDEKCQTVNYTFCSVPFAQILVEMVGVSFANKRVPVEIMSASREIQKCFLDGVLDGKDQMNLKVGSPDLAYGIKVLLASQGRWAMVYPCETFFNVCIQDDFSDEQYIVEDDYVWNSVDRIELSQKQCEVFNIEVAEDNSYVGDVTVHNCELYVNRYHTEATPDVASRDKFVNSLSEEDKKQFRVRGSHLLAIAYSDIGYSNLIRLTTWAYLNGFYGKPRVNYEQLIKHKEGLIFTSCCYSSEVGRAFEYGGKSYEEKRDAACVAIERYIQMFGNKFKLEIMMLDFSKQKPYDRFIIWAAEKYKLEIILTNDVHFCEAEDSQYQQLMLMQQTGKTMLDIKKAAETEGIEDIFELQDKNLWMKTEEELNDMWVRDYSDVIDLDIFQAAKANTVKICEMAKGVQFDRSNKLPKLPDDEARLNDYIQRGFRERHISGVVYKRRAAVEYELICRKGFASYFIIKKMMVDEARRYYREDLKLGSGYEAVGPGRGCLHGNCRVIVGTGSKEISKVIEGDMVWCRDGVARPVKKIWVYSCQEDLVSIDLFYSGDSDLRLTKDHKVLVIKGEPKVKDLKWVAAENIVIGDWLFSPKPQFDENTDSKKIGDIVGWYKNISIENEAIFCDVEEGVFCRVKKIAVLKHDGFVYDLEVDDDVQKNYLTENGIVHNSAVGALTCYLLGITDVDPIQEGLLFDRFLSDNRGGRQIKLRFLGEPME